ncbi:MAG: hypothetical protein JEY91_08385 [Spirochaetaceae bacterium]|nr:hypothetical protein [Spirochaetaceae bacterium]
MYSNETFNSATDEFLGLIRPLHGEITDFKPQSDYWTIEENIIHVCESEINAYFRLRTILAEPGIDTFVTNEQSWAESIKGFKPHLDLFVEIFKNIRALESQILTTLNYNDFSENYVIHRDFGKVSIQTWIDWYSEKHIQFHMDLINRNIRLWNEQK